MSAQSQIKGIAAGRFKRRQFGRGHAYYLDGEKLDGVTTMLGDGVRKKALEEWAGNVTADYAVDHWDELDKLPFSQRLAALKKARYEVRDAASRRGTEVHNLAEQTLQGAEVAVPDELAGHVESAVRFMDEWQVEHIVAEASCCNIDERLGGTLDLIFRSPLFPGRTFLADWKTSKDIYGEVAFQLECYGRSDFYLDGAGVEQSMADLNITDHVAIHVRSDGYTVYPMERGDQVWSIAKTIIENARNTRDSDRIRSLRGDAMYLPGTAA